MSALETADLAPAEKLVLRALAGPGGGRLVEVDLGSVLSVGGAFSNDVVVRDPTAADVQLRILFGRDSSKLTLFSGEVSMLGRSIQAPADILWPAYLPLVLGRTALVFGSESHARWSDAYRILEAMTDADESSDGAAAVPGAGGPLGAWRRRLLRLAPAGAAIAIGGLAGSTLAVAVLGGPASTTPNASVGATRQILDRAGFGRLLVASGPGGHLVVRGLVPTDAALNRLRVLVSTRPLSATVAVSSQEAIARSVETMFRAQGLSAQASLASGQVITVQVANGDPLRIDSLRREALREFPQVGDIEVEQTATSVAELPSGGSDPSQRVTEFVGGPAGYIATASGDRYFVGATLPEGQKVVSFGKDSVQLEADNRLTTVKF